MWRFSKSAVAKNDQQRLLLVYPMAALAQSGAKVYV
jgi:hypothetical protein